MPGLIPVLNTFQPLPVYALIVVCQRMIGVVKAGCSFIGLKTADLISGTFMGRSLLPASDNIILAGSMPYVMEKFDGIIISRPFQDAPVDKGNRKPVSPVVELEQSIDNLADPVIIHSACGNEPGISKDIEFKRRIIVFNVKQRLIAICKSRNVKILCHIGRKVLLSVDSQGTAVFRIRRNRDGLSMIAV